MENTRYAKEKSILKTIQFIVHRYIKRTLFICQKRILEQAGLNSLKIKLDKFSLIGESSRCAGKLVLKKSTITLYTYY